MDLLLASSYLLELVNQELNRGRRSGRWLWGCCCPLRIIFVFSLVTDGGSAQDEVLFSSKFLYASVIVDRAVECGIRN